MRIEKEYKFLNSNKIDYYTNQVLYKFDDFLGKVINSFDFRHSKIYIIVSYPSKAAINRGELLTSIIVAGKGIDNGLITSSTTRRDGLIANTDIMQSILTDFSIFNSENEKYVYSIEDNNNIDNIKKLNDIISRNHLNRSSFIKTFITTIIIYLITTVMVLFYKKHNYYKKIIYFLIIISFLLLIFPFSIISLPLFYYYNYFLDLIFYIVLLGVITLVLLFFISRTIFKSMSIYLSLPFSICLLTTIIIFFDIISNFNIARNSLLGYCPIIGARYYGIGNELAGFLIGSTLTSWAILNHYKIKNGIPIIVFLIVLVIGHPDYGANVGATVTAISCFSTYYLLTKKKKIFFRDVFKIILWILTFILFFYLFDQFISNNKTHLANSINRLLLGDVKSVFEIINRKLIINLRLLRWTIWSRVLLTSILVLIILFHKPRGILYDTYNRYKFIKELMWSTLIASLIGILTNDSGVVIAATTIIFPIIVLVLLILNVVIKKDLLKN